MNICKLCLLSVLIVSSLVSIYVSQVAVAQVLRFDTDKNLYSPGDELVVFGRGVPNDGLIASLFNPNGELIFTGQVDTGSDGSFAKILLNWPSPDRRYLTGCCYTLTLRSSIAEDIFASRVLRFIDIATPPTTPDTSRNLEVSIVAPTVMGTDERAKILIQVKLDGILVSSDPTILKDSLILYPDGTQTPIENMRAVFDGTFSIDFESDMIGQHVILVQARTQQLSASGIAGILVEEGSVLSLGSELASISTNIEELRVDTSAQVDRLNGMMEQVSAAYGQTVSLMLPVIGMIAVIVAMQATLLARKR